MKTPLFYLFLALTTTLFADVEVIEKWEFSEPDGTQFSGMFSNSGTHLANVDRASASVSDGKLTFTNAGDEDSIFLINAFAARGLASGVYEASWTYTDADFSATHEAGARASIGFDLRDNNGTAYKGYDDLLIGGVRLNYEKQWIELQYQDSVAENYIRIAKIERSILPAPLHVRMRIDLDKSGEPGSFQVFLKLGDEDEINPLTDGVISAGAKLSSYRILQQITNGNTNWKKGDSVSIDNFTLSRAF
ncbi:MAG TPA: hypothetical protein DCX06_12595 [Opitutae bacterium]|nr:hypothetical protein [Opitutae bacterium]